MLSVLGQSGIIKKRKDYRSGSVSDEKGRVYEN